MEAAAHASVPSDAAVWPGQAKGKQRAGAGLILLAILGLAGRLMPKPPVIPLLRA
ncbi:MAG: hypothetical protein QOF70_1166 [Acetobacteraceae bacterium]|jgi:hypothetical protein|nr:hypothetical protein [Rhodopila sp.]MEA2726691.1 hypothetical protein [Acetobacteraceae bacterium]